MALPGNGTIPAVDAARIRLAKDTGFMIMELLKKDIRLGYSERGAFINGVTVDMALGVATPCCTFLQLPVRRGLI